MDYKALKNNMLISGMEKQSPQAAELFRIFERHGVDGLTALQILPNTAASSGRDKQKGSGTT